jgi:hypothetical protein
VAEAHAARTRWAVAGYLAIATFVVVHLGWLLSVIGFVNGVEASGVTGRTVIGTVSPWGSEVQVALSPGHTLSATLPLSLWALTLLVFLVAAQPWRPWVHRRGAAQSARA